MGTIVDTSKICKTLLEVCQASKILRGRPMEDRIRHYHPRQPTTMQSDAVEDARQCSASYKSEMLDEGYRRHIYQHASTGPMQIENSTQALRANGSYAIPSVMTPTEQPSLVMGGRGYPVF